MNQVLFLYLTYIRPFSDFLARQYELLWQCRRARTSLLCTTQRLDVSVVTLV